MAEHRGDGLRAALHLLKGLRRVESDHRLVAPDVVAQVVPG
jgi:hypothetical protein